MDKESGVTHLHDGEALREHVAANAAVAIYFAGADCGVCHVLEPKLRALLAGSFPQLVYARVAVEEAADLAAQQSVFALPTLLIFFDGRETFRYSRNFSPSEVARDLARPYSLYFET